jgi:hypothetical protein
MSHVDKLSKHDAVEYTIPPVLLAYALWRAEHLNDTDGIVYAENAIIATLELDPNETEQGLTHAASTRVDAFLHAYLGVIVRGRPALGHLEVDRVAIAAAAYLETYQGPWGLKASSEDALLNILSWLWPDDWTSSGGGIEKLRAHPELSKLSTVMWEELECEAMTPREIAEGILPKIDAVLGERAE